MDFLIFLWYIIFFITSFLYSSVGLGGASAYLAYFSIMGVEKISNIPIYALILSIFSSLFGLLNWRKFLNIKKFLPFIIPSSIFSFFGGMMKISEKKLDIIISLVLIILGIIMIFGNVEKKQEKEKEENITIGIIFGGAFGFLGGVVGIGCGVFLTPLISILGISRYPESYSAGIFFIFINSIFGFLGHLTKVSIKDVFFGAKFLIPVILGAFLGSKISTEKLKPKTVKILFGISIILIAILRTIK